MNSPTARDYDAFEQMTSDELRALYDRVVSAGADSLSVGLSMGGSVMTGSAIKCELRSRGERL